MPRPPIQHVRHFLVIDDGTQDLIRELKDAYLQVHGIKAAGRALAGALSHPVGYLSILGAVIFALHTIPGVRDVVVKFEKEQAEAAGQATEEFVKNTWRSVSEGSAARTENEREMYEGWIQSLWNGIKWVFQF